jgi:hypothetical protein
MGREAAMNKAIRLAAGMSAALFIMAGPVQAEDLVFMLTNKTDGVVERFYTSPVGVEEWEEDVFGKNVLQPGDSVRITIADGRRVCKYDLRFEFTEDSGYENLEDSQDLCEMGSYVIHE